jgi:predicted ABC-type ATPase
MDFSPFDQRPIVIAIAGPNGAGKTTFYHAHLAAAGLRFINADVISHQLALAPYDAARVADALRRELLSQGESFVFETVFSDPVGDKVAFLEDAGRRGHIVILCYIGLANAAQSTERVAMRVSQSGHDVPDDKLLSRYSRTLDNLRAAMLRLPHVLVYDNSDLRTPFRQVAVFDHGQLHDLHEPVPDWLSPLIPQQG